MLPLTDEERRIILEKHTEPPFSGRYTRTFDEGVYLCRQCGTPLFRSEAKFACDCGWPAFDDAAPGAVENVPDPDGQRTECVCADCKGHLGHVFHGEGLTPKNVRYCINSLSLFFRQREKEEQSSRHSGPMREEKAVFAGGCFWGIEDAFHKVRGVVDVVSGYTGGTTENPTYEEVCSGATGHAEAVMVRFVPEVVQYETLARFFFEIHDPTQLNRQGMDMGTQYRSAVFYANNEQKNIIYSLVKQLKDLGWRVVTQVKPLGSFYEAEAYHQKFTQRTGRGGCHLRVRRFNQKPR